MITKKELLEIVINEINGCEESIEFIKGCKDINEVIEKASGEYWTILLIYSSQFSEYCDWSKLDGYNWRILLKYQPQFSEYCDWSKLDGYDWSYLLEYQPQLIIYKKEK